jgi:hypothetical protein
MQSYDPKGTHADQFTENGISGLNVPRQPCIVTLRDLSPYEQGTMYRRRVPITSLATSMGRMAALHHEPTQLCQRRVRLGRRSKPVERSFSPT